jgi:hypothetical protein
MSGNNFMVEEHVAETLLHFQVERKQREGSTGRDQCNI